jgi:uncharacterized membrane protein
MDLHTVQLVFYILGIVFLSLLIFIALFVLLTVLFVRKKVMQVSDLVTEKITKVSDIFDYKEEFASEMLVKGAGMMLRRVGMLFMKRTKSQPENDK